ncbi:hypothetical protein GCM10009122_36520 [Fulvivirga kasyanovii]|uniref:Crp/Fnr family transcriptional regulator n=1 Tax=Fulvivirga kasyanovii TaxID=396812 RepID=A0ABW9RZB9_9BACT|nr:Crp/Fnr family transcriptional regulator [Fulvivirga kasyanovii]MTI29141.1 Crp/Fnr family transcriptional regulator [Fulvivirga kasyanovii]
MSNLEHQVLFEFLNNISPVSDELWGEISRFIRQKSYTKGECILREGEIETRSNVVIKGVVHQFVYDDDVTITTNLTPSGFPFNSLKSYIEGSPSIEVQEAITDVDLLYMEKQDLEDLVIRSHEFSYLMYKIHENILLDRENRMFLLQYRNPSKRFRLFHESVERSKGLTGCTPDKFLASYLNMTPQQYSREKRNLKKLHC